LVHDIVRRKTGFKKLTAPLAYSRPLSSVSGKLGHLGARPGEDMGMPETSL
jgi:hypothetical protein